VTTYSQAPSAVAATAWAEFPWEAIIDAVAPYYPIQFTPPPNNPVGITRIQLRKAFVGVFDICMSPSALSSLVGMIVDRLLVDDDEREEEDGSLYGRGRNDLHSDLSAEDKLEAAQDLVWVLMRDTTELANDNDAGAVTMIAPRSPGIHGSKIQCLEVDAVRLLSRALLALFQDSSKEVARLSRQQQQQEEEDPTQQHSLAKRTLDACRLLVSSLAQELEMADAGPSFPSQHRWDAFVAQPVESLAIAGLREPDRVSVAYLSCLAASGGYVQSLFKRNAIPLVASNPLSFAAHSTCSDPRLSVSSSKRALEGCSTRMSRHLLTFPRRFTASVPSSQRATHRWCTWPRNAVSSFTHIRPNPTELRPFRRCTNSSLVACRPHS
jgi:hypothetical protein